MSRCVQWELPCVEDNEWSEPREEESVEDAHIADDVLPSNRQPAAAHVAPLRVGLPRWYASARGFAARRRPWIPSIVRFESAFSIGALRQHVDTNGQHGWRSVHGVQLDIALVLRWDWMPQRVRASPPESRYPAVADGHCMPGDQDCAAAIGAVHEASAVWISAQLRGRR